MTIGKVPNKSSHLWELNPWKIQCLLKLKCAKRSYSLGSDSHTEEFNERNEQDIRELWGT